MACKILFEVERITYLMHIFTYVIFVRRKGGQGKKGSNSSLWFAFKNYPLGYFRIAKVVILLYYSNIKKSL